MTMLLPMLLMGGMMMLMMSNQPKMPKMPDPIPPPKPPIRISETAAQQRATLLTRPVGSGRGMRPAAVGAVSSAPGPVYRPTLLGR